MGAPTLISWLGKTDTGNFYKPETGHGGPLRTILEHRPVDELHLLFTPDPFAPDMAEQAEKIQRAIADRYPKLVCSLHPHEINAADSNMVYFATEKLLEAIWKKKNHGSLLYNLTSGTSAMYGALQLLGSVVYPGELLRTIDPKYGGPPVATVTLPFQLALIPQKMQISPNGAMPVATVNQPIFDRVAHKIAPSKAPILILGESGVGKTELAKHLHAHSIRSKKIMISENCAALSSDRTAVVSALFGHEAGAYTDAKTRHDGAFIRANGSTLFLDEIGDLPLDVQGTLLTVLDSGLVTRMGSSKSEEVDVRVIAATNKDLVQEVRNNRFRADLYYRLATYTPVLAPVREYAVKDRRAVLEYFWRDVEASCRNENPEVMPLRKKIAATAMHRLENAQWPGNLRQMRQCLYSLYLLGDTEITLADVEEQLGRAMPEGGTVEAFLPASLPAGVSLKEWGDNAKHHFIKEALRVSGGNVTKAARSLGMKDTTLRDVCNKLGIQ